MKRYFIICCCLLFANRVAAQNVGIGTITPYNKLEVRGSVLISELLSYSNTVPTAGQTFTMVNGSPATMLETDSVARVYDPGGPSGNYVSNIQGIVYISPVFQSVGLEFILDDLQLGTGDSLLITSYDSEFAPRVKIYTSGNAASTYIHNATAASVIFKSNSDASNGRGFSMLVRRVYSDTSTQAPKNFAGHYFLFDARKGALRVNGISEDTIGLWSVAFGTASAPGQGSFAVVQSSVASGLVSSALNGGKARGNRSLAIGTDAVATAFRSVAIGMNVAANGVESIALGRNSIAGGNSTYAIGNSVHAAGPGTIAIGNTALCTNTNSICLGNTVEAANEGAFCIGNNSRAAGYRSFTLGNEALAQGSQSIAIGNEVTAQGNNSIALGSYVSTSGFSGCLTIGDNSTTDVMETFVSNGFRSRFASGYRLFTNSAATIGAFLNGNANAWAALSDVRLKENFLPIDGESFLNKIAAMPQYTWNYIGQDAKTLRHYGPMAQDFYKAFGKDSLGEIGCDTLINQQDFLGVNLIAIQALEKRTNELLERIEKLEAENWELRRNRKAKRENRK